jgi:hypothetical protein
VLLLALVGTNAFFLGMATTASVARELFDHTLGEAGLESVTRVTHDFSLS